MKGVFEAIGRGRSPIRSIGRHSPSRKDESAVDNNGAERSGRYQSNEATDPNTSTSNFHKTRLEIVEPPQQRPVSGRFYRGKQKRSKSIENGFFASIFGTLAAFNELVYDRCEECGDDDISYAYGNFSKSTTTHSSSDDMNTFDESTLNNSTILSETLLHRDWSIATNQIYRDVNQVTSDGYGMLGVVAHHTTGKGLQQTLKPTVSEDLHHRSSLRRHRSRGTKLSKDILDKDGQAVARSRSKGAPVMRRSHSTKIAAPKDSETLQRCRSKSLSHTNDLNHTSSYKQQTGRRGRGPTSTSRRGRSRSQRRERLRSKSRGRNQAERATILSPKSSRDKSLSIKSRRTTMSKTSHTYGRPMARGRSPARHRPTRGRSNSKRRANRVKRDTKSERKGMISRIRDGLKSPKTPIINQTDYLEETRDDVAYFTFDDRGFAAKRENEGSLNIKTKFGNKSIPADLPVPNSPKERLTPKTGSKMGSIKTGLFSWRKNNGSEHESSMAEESRDDVHNPAQVIDISGVPTKSEDLPDPSIDGSEKSNLAFPVPNEEGQEIAIQDDEHCYEDPANVHSMLTMPSFEHHKDESNHKRENNQDAIVLVMTNTEDGSLVTEDGALYSKYAVPKNGTETSEEN